MGRFDRFEVLRQLRCSGIMETVRIRKDGFPFNRKHADFVAYYSVLLPRGANLPKEPREKARALLNALNIAEARFRIGSTKVFLKDDAHHELEGKRSDFYNSAATVIGKSVKGYATKLKFRRILQSTQLLQYWIRQYLAAVDCSEEVKEKLASIRGKANVLASVSTLGELAERDANVDTIVDQGGVRAILDAIDVSILTSPFLQ